MKKFLLSFILFGVALFGNAQVILNEVYTNPSPGNNPPATSNHEFFELYNTGILEEELDCYTLIVYYKTSSSTTGFFVLDLPSGKIGPKGYYVGGSLDPINVQNRKNIDIDFSWNNLGPSPKDPTGSIKKYIRNGSSYNAAIDIPSNETNNIFQTVQGNGEVAVFLFKSGQYINGFLGGFGSGVVPTDITTMPKLTVPYANTTCGTSFEVDWSTIKLAEYTNASGGTDNGYARLFDGSCGTWQKTSANNNNQNTAQTPKATNGSATGESIAGLLTTEDKLCGNKVSFTLTGFSGYASAANTLPVKVHLYFETVSPYGTLDATDVKKETIEVTSASNTVYSFLTAVPTDQRVLIVYETVLGCFDKVVVPQGATGILTSIQRNVCGNRIDYTITATEDAISYSLPIIVQVYPANNGVKVEGSTPLDTREITTFTNGVASGNFTLNPANQDVVLTYAASNCYTLTDGVATPVVGEMTTFQDSYCGKGIKFGVTSVTGDLLGATYGSIVAKLYEDKGTIGTFDNLDVLVPGVPSQQITVNTPSQFNVPTAYQGKALLVVYETPSAACLTEASTPEIKDETVNIAPTGVISQEIDGFGKRTLSYSIDKELTVDGAYPFTLKVYEDIESDGLQIGQMPLATHTFNSEAEVLDNGYSVLIDKNSAAIIIAENLNGWCVFSRELAKVNAPLPVTYASFTATRSNNQVVLEWETAMEENNRGFHVQRNIDGTWKNIGFVFTQANGGNSTSSLKYTFKDANSNKGISQYRILQVDNDGKGKYSEVRSVRGEAMATRITVFPNPSNTGSFNILFEDGSSLRDVMVSDVSGRAIKQYKGVSNSSLTIDNLGAGFYTLQVINRTTGAVATEKVIIKKR